MKKIIVMLIVISLILTGCKNTSKSNDLEKLMTKNEYIIIDVRTNEEYEESHIKDAINIPYDEINKNVNLDKEKNILVYCKSGGRSKVAYEKLTNLGYNVYDLGAYEGIDLPKE